MEEVRCWYFEIWNEPNYPPFWKDADFVVYLQLYERTARVIKQIDPALRVGGPASTGASGVPGQAPGYFGREAIRVAVTGLVTYFQVS